MVQRPPPPPRVLALALLTVALPRARPTPRPLVPLDRNMGAFLTSVSTPPCTAKPTIIPQHVWNNEVSDMAAPNVHLFQMRHATVAGSHSYVLQLNIHIILSCKSLAGSMGVVRADCKHTLDKLAAVNLAGGDFKRDDVALHRISINF